MKYKMPTAALCLVLAAAGAFGQDVDAETRFHRAYEQEVVEGKIADAARVYLDMMRNEKVPERLRAEAKFRFAVTAVLLGRSDEARAYLGEIVHDPKTPDALKARAQEYLDAVKGIGVGSELDKKLQSLVFDLARVSPTANETPPAYRDFEVIGKPAVPFLRQLLRHNDVALRRHAFRLLLRLREPAMMQIWSPEFNLPANWGFEIDLGAYLQELPSERDVFEKKLLTLDDKGLAQALGGDAQPAFSVEFLRAAEARKAAPAKLIALVERNVFRDEGLQRLRYEWVKSEDPALATAATMSFLQHSKYKIPEFVAPTEVLPAVVDHLIGVKLLWAPTSWAATSDASPSNERRAWEGFAALANAVPVATLLDAMETSIARAVPWNGEVGGDPYSSGLVDALAVAVEAKKPEGEALLRYEAAVKKWADAASKSSLTVPALHARFLLLNLPMSEAESLATWIFAGPASSRPNDWSQALPLDRADRIGLALTAYRAAPPSVKPQVAQWLRLNNTPGAAQQGPEMARAVLAILPEIVRGAAAIDPKQMPPVGPFVPYAEALPPEEAQERLVAAVVALASWPRFDERRLGLSGVLGKWGTAPAPQRRYWLDVVLPAMDRVLPALSPDDRGLPFEYAVEWLVQGPNEPTLREGIAGFVMAHLGELPERGAAEALAADPRLFPPSIWVPKVPGRSVDRLRKSSLPAEVADAAVREMTRDPALVNRNVLVFAYTQASAALRTEVFDALLRDAPLDHIPLVLDAADTSTGAPASGHALDDALARVLAAEKPDLNTVARLAVVLARRKPTDRLVPAVRLLLASPTTSHTMAGIETAKSLGREDLLPALATVLDSMEADVRQKAREAIDSIVELRRLKEAARRDAGTAPPQGPK